jgi:hypothetical protein
MCSALDTRVISHEHVMLALASINYQMQHRQLAADQTPDSTVSFDE